MAVAIFVGELEEQSVLLGSLRIELELLHDDPNSETNYK